MTGPYARRWSALIVLCLSLLIVVMSSFPQPEQRVGGANDTSVELGGSLGIAPLGSLVGTGYRDRLTDLVTWDPEGGTQRARALVDAVQEAFAHGIVQTSLIGGIIMIAGTMIVLAVLPGRRYADKRRPKDGRDMREMREMRDTGDAQDADEARRGAA